MFLVNITIKSEVTEEQRSRCLQSHLDFLNEQYEDGKFLLFGAYIPRTGGGLLLSDVDTREELETILAKDPYTIANVTDYTIQEFAVGKIHADIITSK